MAGGVVRPWEVDGAQLRHALLVRHDGHLVQHGALRAGEASTGTPETLPASSSTRSTPSKAIDEPIAVGAGDLWPRGHWWYQFALNVAARLETLQSVDRRASSSTTRAGSRRARCSRSSSASEPFQEGFLADARAGRRRQLNGPHRATASRRDGVHGAAGTRAPSAASRPTSEVPEWLGWFPFPTCPARPATRRQPLGGGDGLAARAPTRRRVRRALLALPRRATGVQRRFAGGGGPASRPARRRPTR